MKNRVMIYLASACMVLTGCWDADKAMEATPSGDYMRTADVVVAGDATQGSIHVDANCQWTIATEDTWLSLGISTGQGNADVAVTMTQNPSSAQERTATVKLQSASGISTTLKVRQERNSEQITVVPAEMEFAAENAGYLEFTVTANGHWIITGIPAWITLSKTEGTGSGSVQVSVSANTDENSRTAVMTLTGDGGQTATVSVTQRSRSTTLVVSPQNMTVAAIGEQKNFTISGNIGWMLSASDDWLTSFSAKSGSGQQDVTFTCQPNHTTGQRSATINITSENGHQTVTVNVTQEAGQLPKLTKLLLLDSDEQQATMTSSVESMFELTEYGICYSESANPTIAGTKIVLGRETPAESTFQTTVTGLTKGNTYYARAYAISAVGTAYSEELSFVALPMPQNDDNDRPAFSRRK